jgi:hypothetical protein
MIWVTWRQHRSQAVACLILLFALAVFAVAVGAWMRSAFASEGLPACLARSGGAGCPAVVASFVSRFSHSSAATVISLPLIAIPGLLGIVTGAPLLGRELEQGTWRLAWTQTVPRTRWLAVKLGLVTGALVAFGAAVTALMTWYRAPLDQVTSRVQPDLVNAEGLTFTASLLCAFGLAVLAGLLLRNVIAAMVAAYIAWEVPATVVLLMTAGPLRLPPAATMRVPCRDGCPGATLSSVPPVTGHLGDYVLSITRGGGGLVVRYLPASRFWTMQLIQGGLLLAVAAAALGTAIWLLHKRTT